MTGDPDHEQVADTLIKDDLRRHASVGTADDEGDRALARLYGLQSRLPAVGMEGPSLHETTVPILKAPPCVVGVHRREIQVQIRGWSGDGIGVRWIVDREVLREARPPIDR